MKIALISSGSGSRGDGEIYLRFLAQGLRDSGHEVTVLVPDAARMNDLAHDLAPFAAVQRYAFRATYDRKLRTLGAWMDRAQQKLLATQFAELDADILHVNQQVAEDAVDLVLAAAASGRPWVSTIHVGHSARSLGAKAGSARDWVTQKALHRAGGDYIAVSATSARQMADRFSAKVHVVLNGVPLPDPQGLTEARSKARADWGVSDETLVVGTVGRIEAQKNPLALIDHMAPVAKNTGDLQLVWIGDGAMHQALVDHAAPHAARLPLHIDGWRSDAALRMAGLDIFVLPSVFEGLPLALLEAMHAGLPIVASHADGIAEAIQTGETGFLCETDDDWNTALTRLVSDPTLRLSIGDAARMSAQTSFSTDAMAAGTLRVYAEVLDRHKDAP